MLPSMDPALTQEERAALVKQLRDLNTKLYPDNDVATLHGDERARLKAEYFEILETYFKRLPRVTMSVCPFTQKPLERMFDPFSLDGPWWHRERLVEINEPEPPKTFKVLLGALHLGDRIPSEVNEEVRPGPEVPYVIPTLLELPGMVAVIGGLPLLTGDTAYTIAYFSESEIDPPKLRRSWSWLREDESWLPDGSGAWSTADVWDFDLAPYIASGKVKWLEPGDLQGGVFDSNSKKPCPYLDLPGERRPQQLVKGKRIFLPVPGEEDWL